jgi:hypothetical protein
MLNQLMRPPLPPQVLIRPEFSLMISVIKTFLVVARVDFPGKIGTLFDGRICHSY